jgi:DNA-binding NtrC family response regulator
VDVVSPPAATDVPGRAAVARRVVTVLLAEDDHAVRRVAARILRNAGYRVLEAGDGRSAFALWRAHAAELDILGRRRADAAAAGR